MSLLALDMLLANLNQFSRYKEVVLFRQQALRSRRLVNIRNAIIQASKDHVVSMVTPVTTDTESDENSLFGDGKFDDVLSSFCNDFNS